MKRNIIKSLIIVLIGLMSIYFGYLVTKLNILPSKYFVPFIAILVTLNLIAGICLLVKKIWPKVISVICYIILILVSIIGIKYSSETVKFLDESFNNNNKEITTYSVLVKTTSSYKSLNDLKDKKLGYLSTDPQTDEYLKIVSKKIVTTNTPYEDLFTLYENFMNESVDSIVLDEAYLDVLAEEDNELDNKVRELFRFDIEKEIIKENVKVKELVPFNVYISGSDSRSAQIYNKSRSDVNMILTINPKNRTILMTSIPRDYYVQVHGQTGLKDKLTHAGIYGIDVSRQTVEDLFDIKIDYSIKLGFNSVVTLVDLVGGVDIDSDRTFNSYHIPGWVVNKGINHMNGREALAYARERYAYRTGDRHRIQNQQQVLEATMKKIMVNKSILLKYDSLLTSLSALYRTDIPKEVVTSLVKMQLDDMSTWKFTSQTVSGSDASLPTHTAPSKKRYVMIPYEKDVKRATKTINETLKIEEESV